MRSHAPENTMAAFQAALSHGFPHIELDVQLLADGTCVVFHDDTLDRTTDSSGRLDQVCAQQGGRVSNAN
jgi:glycerophosphoryl diester phosphodiesterase